MENIVYSYFKYKEKLNESFLFVCNNIKIKVQQPRQIITEHYTEIPHIQQAPVAFSQWYTHQNPHRREYVHSVPLAPPIYFQNNFQPYNNNNNMNNFWAFQQLQQQQSYFQPSPMHMNNYNLAQSFNNNFITPQAYYQSPYMGYANPHAYQGYNYLYRPPNYF